MAADDHMGRMMQRCAVALLALLICAPAGFAGPAASYRQALNRAAQGDDEAALTMLHAVADTEPAGSVWRQRFNAAAQLIGMRKAQQTGVPARIGPNPYLALASTYASAHPLLPEARDWPATLLAVLLPGAGHAWQGRWKDAAMAAMMVWPMLILTVWAAKRRMGPVTVFFALITLWLWSGTVFSSMSLAERANAETYMAWWQGVWQTSGLPGRPW